MFTKRNILKISLVLLALTGTLFIYRSTASSDDEVEASCKETPAIEKKAVNQKMSWEIPSQQFFS